MPNMQIRKWEPNKYTYVMVENVMDRNTEAMSSEQWLQL